MGQWLYPFMSNLKERYGAISGTMRTERVFKKRGEHSIFVDRERER